MKALAEEGITDDFEPAAPLPDYETGDFDINDLACYRLPNGKIVAVGDRTTLDNPAVYESERYMVSTGSAEYFETFGQVVDRLEDLQE